MTLKTGVKAADNSALCHRNKLHFNIYYNRKLFVYIVMLFYNITVFLILPCGHKRLL